MRAHMDMEADRVAERWTAAARHETPGYEVVATDGAVRAILYPNEPYLGRPSRVFAYMGVPHVQAEGATMPGMVLVHGGEGAAFREWVELWNRRGYAAIAMDLNGCGPNGRLPDGGPALDHPRIFGDLATRGWRACWTYHAVAAVMRAHSIVRHQPGVDPARIGVTGISWGGYLTCILAGVDDRFACAVPVYGCGFLGESGAWRDDFAPMSALERHQWDALCDPSAYLGDARLPMLFINGTNDVGFPLDSYKRSYTLARGPLTLSVRREMPHGHAEGWVPPEIALFADHLFRGAPALPRVGPMVRTGAGISAPVAADRPLVAGMLLYTKDGGPWPGRRWEQGPAGVEGRRVVAALPRDAAAYYLAVTDEAGAFVSCPHEESGPA